MEYLMELMNSEISFGALEFIVMGAVFAVAGFGVGVSIIMSGADNVIIKNMEDGE